MLKLAKKLAIIFLPVIIYFAVFIYFEPYNYFGLKNSEYSGDSPIVRLREFEKNKQNCIIVGDSRMAHFDMQKAQEYAGKNISQLSFGGASFKESMDLLEYALEQNPDIDTVYFGASFYTLNKNYFKDRMSQLKTISQNPFAYMLNFNYNIEMLGEIRYALKGEKNVAENKEGLWTDEDYFFEDGSKRPYRKNLQEYADVIYDVCTNAPYSVDEKNVQRYIELTKKCFKDGITIYTVLPPMDDSIKELVVDELNLGDDILQFAEKASLYTTVLNYEYTDTNFFTADQFYDGFHLDPVRGLPIFTEMLFTQAKG